jgi:predicted transcriptional regulator
MIGRFFTAHVAAARRRAVPVVDDAGHYAGMLFLSDVLDIDPSEWAMTPVSDVMRRDAPVGRADWTIGQALAVMVAGDVDHLPVVDANGEIDGVCTTVDILDLDELLERLDPGDGDQSTPH